MGVVAWITGIVLTVGFVGSGAMKAMGLPMAKEMAAKLDFEKIRLPLGVAEIAGGVGILLGLFGGNWEWFGFLAAVGLASIMLGAVSYHARVDDEAKEVAPAIVMLLLSVLYIIAIATR